MASRRVGVGQRLLDMVERIGNRLPEPATLFVIGAVLVMALSHIAVSRGWSVMPVRVERVLGDGGGPGKLKLVETGEPIRAVSLLTRDGIYWAISGMVDNFIRFPPLGIILTCMLGVGVAERTGLIGTVLRAVMLVVPGRWLTPTMVFLGVNASLATDAGYIVLPPLAAAMYRAVGRPPLAGVAAVFAGLAGGFNANLLITSLDPLLAGLSQSGARLIDPAYHVSPTCNWWMMIAATFVLTAAGWAVTAWFVEPRLRAAGQDAESTPAGSEDLAVGQLTKSEWCGLLAACGALAATLGLIGWLVLIPGAPLHGVVDAAAQSSPARWMAAIVPMILALFLIPGAAYGIVTGTLRRERDLARFMAEAVAAMAPVVVMAFFAAQFLRYCEYSNLGAMLAMTGGRWLAASGLRPELLLVGFIVITVLFDMIVVSMSAKYTLFAPIFIPMFMMVGISPELTQCAYRIGDSVVNTVSPLNPYLVVILAVVRRYAPRSGMGTLVSMMLPYAIVFALVWTALLVAWIAMNFELGPGGPLWYAPAR